MQRLPPEFAVLDQEHVLVGTFRHVGDGNHLHPDGAWLRLSGRRALSWRVSITMEAAFCVESCLIVNGTHPSAFVF
jgi:hypothetical protein